MTDEHSKEWKDGYIAGVLTGYTEGIGAVLREFSENHRIIVNPGMFESSKYRCSCGMHLLRGSIEVWQTHMQHVIVNMAKRSRAPEPPFKGGIKPKKPPSNPPAHREGA